MTRKAAIERLMREQKATTEFYDKCVAEFGKFYCRRHHCLGHVGNRLREQPR